MKFLFFFVSFMAIVWAQEESPSPCSYLWTQKYTSKGAFETYKMMLIKAANSTDTDISTMCNEKLDSQCFQELEAHYAALPR